MNSNRIPNAKLHCGAWARTLVLSLLSVQLGAGISNAAGTVAGWGANESQETQAPAGLTNVIAVAAGASHSLALQSDGILTGWGSNGEGEATVPAGLTGVRAIAAGSNYSLALGSDGTVQAWGNLLPPPAGLSNVAAIAAGASHALALGTDGTVVCWGSQTNVPAGLTNVIAISAGKGQSLALRADRTVVAWGDGSFGKTKLPIGLTKVIAIAAGGDHCLALRKDGTIVGWGRNDHGQITIPADLTNVVAIGAGALHSLALRADGSLIAWGDNSLGQVSGTPAGSGYGGIAAGAYHNLAIQSGGSPVIILQPVSQTVDYLQGAIFEVVAVGAPSLTYQWQRDGRNLIGMTKSVLNLPSVQPYNGGVYTVVVRNALGSVTSTPVTLTVAGLVPQLTVSIQDTTVVCGDSVSFQVQATGPSPTGQLNYQWSFQGVPIDNATGTNLALSNVTTAQGGQYSVTVTNQYGSTSASALLTVQVDPVVITSPLTAVATQGSPFSYSIQASHSPLSFSALFLPNGLNIDTNSGVISGTPLDSGAFSSIISAFNTCTNGTATLQLNIASSVPVLRTAPTATGTEGVPLNYQITASGPNLSYAAQNLPPGLGVNTNSGLISGTPVLAGSYNSVVSASNRWGTATAAVRFSITNAPITGLSIGKVTYNYSSPYLLDFSFSLLNNDDPTLGTGVTIDPRLLSVTCFEDTNQISASETGAFISRTSTKVIKAFMVLDFTQSIASLANGDTNRDGISDAVDSMVNGSILFVNEQSIETQVGVYEFHREDVNPSKVTGLTTDKAAVDNAIAGIWTNSVQGFPAGSRCWDALMAAVKDLGAANRDEQHCVILISDGQDESSTNALADVIKAATTAKVQVFAVGFGTELNATNLQDLATQTQGRYFPAQSAEDIANQLAQISKITRGQYLLRWATLKRSTNDFMPSFQISYQGFTAYSPTNPYTLGDTNVDTTVDPPVTNSTPSVTNFIIGYYSTRSNAGPVLVGSLRLVPNAEVQPTGLDLRAAYVPRYVRQIRLHYRPNWPCTATLQSTAPGEFLSGWSMAQTNDGTGGNWLLLSSPTPNQPSNSLPFASFGKLVTFAFQDPINPTNAFSQLDIDNTLYTNTGGQSFALESTNTFLRFYPPLPYGTPVPWLMSFGYTGNFTNAESLDPDNDGMANWQEFRANTNPTNAASVFTIRSASRQPDGRYQVTFTTATNRTYRLDASSDLINWRTVQDLIPGINQDIAVTDNAVIPILTNIFYRVLVH